VVDALDDAGIPCPKQVWPKGFAASPYARLEGLEECWGPLVLLGTKPIDSHRSDRQPVDIRFCRVRPEVACVDTPFQGRARAGVAPPCADSSVLRQGCGPNSGFLPRCMRS